MLDRKRVFVSSTYKDLAAERQAVEDVLKRMKDADLQMMEYWGSRENTPVEVSLQELEGSQVYLGIFAGRYGSIDPATGMSITEREYRRSVELGLHHLMYFKLPDAPVPRGSDDTDSGAAKRLRRLKKEISEKHTPDYFRSPEELGLKVATALHNLFVEAGWCRRVPFQAPRPPDVFVGRDEELAELRERLLGGETVGIVGLHGMGGIGKTALAAKLAHELREELRDGVVWCDVGERDPLTVLSDMAWAYGVKVDPATDLEGRAAFVRSLLSEKRALLVLDDVRKANIPNLKHLLPPPPCACVVTSRRESLPGVTTSKLETLDEEEGLDLLRDFIGPPRVEAEPDAAKRIYELTGGLPLALEIAAQRLAQRETWTLQRFAERLERARLAELEVGDEKTLSVRASLRVSNDELDKVEQGRYRALGAFEADFSVEACAAVWPAIPASGQPQERRWTDRARAWLRRVLGAGNRGLERLPVRETRQVLERLCRLSLLTCVSEDRYKLHDLLRDFAREELAKAGEEEAVREQQVAYFLGYVRQHKQEYDALEVEWRNVQGVLEWLEGRESSRHRRALMGMHDALEEFLDTRGYWRQAIRWGDAAAEAARAVGDESAVARFSGNVGTMHYLMGDYAEARRRHEAALEAYRQMGEERNVAVALDHLGVLARLEGEYGEARRLHEESLEMARRLGDPSGIAGTLHELGLLAQAQGDYAEARRLYEESLEMQRQLGDPSRIARLVGQLGVLAQDEGEHSGARRLYEESLEMARQLGEPDGIARSLHQLGRLAEIEGKMEDAAELFEQSLQVFVRLHSPHAATARKSLERVRRAATSKR